MENVQKRGRPRSFDCGDVLDQALLLFWRQGYEGTSYADLTAATGLSKPSLYAAFGDKEALFSAVLDRYNQGPPARLIAAFQANEDWCDAVTGLLEGYVALYTGQATASGCLAGSTMAEAQAPGFPERLRRKVAETMAAGKTAITARAQRAAEAGALPQGMTVEDVVALLLTIAYGIATGAKAGMAREDLLRCASRVAGLVCGPEDTARHKTAAPAPQV